MVYRSLITRGSLGKIKLVAGQISPLTGRIILLKIAANIYSSEGSPKRPHSSTRVCSVQHLSLGHTE